MITKAIIPVAGYGTRRLPITKAIEKCMLPICNRPIVDYIVAECIENGITDIYFIVSPEHQQLRMYYGSNQRLEDYLRERGKNDMLASVAVNDKARFHYLIQTPEDPYGTAVPVWLAREVIGDDEQFVVMTGDDFLFAPEQPGVNLHNMLAAAEHFPSAILAATVQREKIELYGAIKTRAGHDGFELFEDIVEKPSPDAAPSNLVNVSKYIFHRDIFNFIEKVMRQPSAGGEHLLTDAVNGYVNNGYELAVVPTVGQYLDGGNLPRWIEANNIVFASL